MSRLNQTQSPAVQKAKIGFFEPSKSVKRLCPRPHCTSVVKALMD